MNAKKVLEILPIPYKDAYRHSMYCFINKEQQDLDHDGIGNTIFYTSTACSGRGNRLDEAFIIIHNHELFNEL